MNKESQKVIEEIIKLQPQVITIEGDMQPEYSGRCFFHSLVTLEIGIMNNSYLYVQHYEHPIFWGGTVAEWISKTIKNINPNYQIIKYKGIYVVGDYKINEPPYYSKQHGVIVDYGGTLEIQHIDTNQID